MPNQEPERSDNERATRPIQYINSDEFADGDDGLLQPPDGSLFREEDEPKRRLNSEYVAESLRAALDQSKLLTPEGERFLFRQLNFLRFRAKAVQSTLSTKRPQKKKIHEINSLLEQAGRAREQIAQSSLRLVAGIASRLSKSADEFDELLAEGNAILLYAIDKFDYSRGFRFSTYATHAVERHLFRVIKKANRRKDKEFSAEEVFAQTPGEERDELLESEKSMELVRQIMSRMDEALDERERLIILGRFGLDDSGQSKTYQTLGEQLGVSKERIRQLLNRALEKLHEIARPHSEQVF